MKPETFASLLSAILYKKRLVNVAMSLLSTNFLITDFVHNCVNCFIGRC